MGVPQQVFYGLFCERTDQDKKGYHREHVLIKIREQFREKYNN